MKIQKLRIIKVHKVTVLQMLKLQYCTEKNQAMYFYFLLNMFIYICILI
jgi:hypothetical protein